MVMMFGALSFAMTQGFRGGGAGAIREKARITAHEVIEYANTYKTAVKALRIGGCRDTDLNFETPLNTTYDANPAATGNKACDAFDLNAGRSYEKPRPEWTDASQSASAGYGQLIVTGQTEVAGVGTTCASMDETCSELLLFVPFVSKDVCREINSLLGVSLDGDGNPPKISGNISAKRFEGEYRNGRTLEDSGGRLRGKQAACFEGDQKIDEYGSSSQDLDDGEGTYHFYQVLLAR